MTLYEFNTLSSQEQTDCLTRQGCYLITRYRDQFALNLYAVDNFFVEVWYSPEHNKICGLLSFSSVKALDDYLPLIRLEW